MPQRKSRRWWILLAILVALVALAVWWWKRPQVVPVEVATVARGRVEETVTNSRAGTVKARRRAQLSPDSGGRVVALPIRKGAQARKGDVLLELDSTVERADVDLRGRQVAAADADAERACLGAERAQRELERNRRLAEEKLIAPDALDALDTAAREASAGCTSARAARASAAAALDVSERTLAKRVVRAPFDGVVADISTEVGEWITPSPPGLPIPPVIDLLDPSSIYMSYPMDEVDAGWPNFSRRGSRSTRTPASTFLAR